MGDGGASLPFYDASRPFVTGSGLQAADDFVHHPAQTLGAVGVRYVDAVLAHAQGSVSSQLFDALLRRAADAAESLQQIFPHAVFFGQPVVGPQLLRRGTPVGAQVVGLGQGADALPVFLGDELALQGEAVEIVGLPRRTSLRVQPLVVSCLED